MKHLRHLKHTFAFLFILCLISTSAHSENARELSAEKILEQVDTIYSTIKSYQDWGVVETDNKKVIFYTLFVNPDRFLFKWGPAQNQKKEEIDFSDYAVIWSNSDGVYTKSTYDKAGSEIEIEKSLGTAVSKATGSSLMAAYIVGSLLMDEPDGWLVGNPNQPVIIGNEEIRGHNCYHIKDVNPRTGTEYHLWIDVQSYLVHKVTTNWPDMEFETNFCEIAINQEIDLAQFDFYRGK